jgi:hypothetical protein
MLQVNIAPRKAPRKALLPTAAKHAPEKQSYKFDHVLGQQATQADLCTAVNIPEKVSSCIDGCVHTCTVKAVSQLQAQINFPQGN